MGDEEEGTFSDIPSIPMRPIDVVLAAAVLLDSVAEAVEDFTTRLVVLIAAHANHKNDQRTFASSVRRELESIPTTEE